MSKRCGKSVSAPAILDSIQRLAKQDSEAFAMLFLQFTSRLVELDRDGYNFVMSGVIHRMSEAWGVQHALGELKQKLAANDIPAAIEALRPPIARK